MKETDRQTDKHRLKRVQNWDTKIEKKKERKIDRPIDGEMGGTE